MNEAETQFAYDRLRELGFNGIGNFTNEEQTRGYNSKVQNANKQYSYTVALNFFQDYIKGPRFSYYPSTPQSIRDFDIAREHTFVLDPKFINFCEEKASTITKYKNDRNLLGYFTDNEIRFNQDQLYNLLNNLTEDDPSYKAALAFITERGIDKSQVTKGGNGVDSVNLKFASYLAERFYKITDSLIRKYDTVHLNLGSRLHGRPRAIEGVVKAAGRYCNVVSANFYDFFTPEEELISPTKWGAWIDKPILIGEFYVKGQDATDNGYVYNYEGAGWLVRHQQDRGAWYHNTIIEFMSSNTVVGCHYFRYKDGNNIVGDGSNKGMFAFREANGSLTNSNLEYETFTSDVEKINNQSYNLLEYFHQRILDTLNKKFTSFSIKYENEFYDGDVLKDTVVVRLPDGANPSSLTPFFTVSAPLAKVFVNGREQNSGENTLNFSQDVVYMLNSRNGMDNPVYLVTVRIYPIFKSFSVISNWRHYNGIIVGNEITIKVPSGTDLKNLIPSFNLSAQAKAYINNVEQISEHAPLNFTNGISYNLRMPNGVENTYRIKVVVEDAPTGVKSSVFNPTISVHDKTIEVANFEEEIEVQIVDIQGIVLVSKKVSSPASIDVGRVGLFIVLLRQRQEGVTRKIILGN
jgi:hypothetical protein